MNDINIVFSTDENYIVPTFVSVFSLIYNKKKESSYHIYIMSKCALPSKMKYMFESITEDKNVEFNWIEVGNIYENFNETSQFTQACYYRLSICDFLPQVDKCIYIDGDTIIKTDLSGMIDIDLGANYLAGCKDMLISWDACQIEKYREMLDLETMEKYINSGVLIMNLKKIREDCLQQKFRNELDRTYNYKFFDQDILNVCCYPNILILGPQYNTFPVYASFLKKHKERIYSKYTKKEIKEANKRPVIVHYASAEKPWNSKTVRKYREWKRVVDKLDANIKAEIVNPYISRQTKYYTEKNGTAFMRFLNKLIKKGYSVTKKKRKIDGAH